MNRNESKRSKRKRKHIDILKKTKTEIVSLGANPDVVDMITEKLEEIPSEHYEEAIKYLLYKMECMINHTDN